MRDIWFGVVVWIIIIFVIVGVVIFQIYICVWVYRDAKKRNMDEILWLIIVLIFGLLGLIIYLIIRNPIVPEKSKQPVKQTQTPTETITPKEIPKEKITKFCPMCGAKIPVEAQFCSYCGNKIQE
jgi:NADH:ubiquinone oxidoreductase subunit 6 (subunit J)